MCTIIVINRGEKEIETPAQFQEHFGFLPVIDEHYKKFIMDACLCQCDIDETFRLHNIQYKTDYVNYYVGQLELVKGDND